jgi:hypothetical protein
MASRTASESHVFRPAWRYRCASLLVEVVVSLDCSNSLKDARGMLYSGKAIDATTAVDMGLVDQVVSERNLDEYIGALTMESSTAKRFREIGDVEGLQAHSSGCTNPTDPERALSNIGFPGRELTRRTRYPDRA